MFLNNYNPLFKSTYMYKSPDFHHTHTDTDMHVYAHTYMHSAHAHVHMLTHARTCTYTPKCVLHSG